jgi:transcriptional regulator GlxA family with amidase domain
MRVEAARPRVEDGQQTLEAIAQTVGFVDAERMRQSFVRILGYTPQSLRRAVRNPHSQG